MATQKWHPLELLPEQIREISGDQNIRAGLCKRSCKVFEAEYEKTSKLKKTVRDETIRRLNMQISLQLLIFNIKKQFPLQTLLKRFRQQKIALSGKDQETKQV